MHPKVVGTTKSPLLKSDGRRSRHTRRLQNLACATATPAACKTLPAQPDSKDIGKRAFRRFQKIEHVIADHPAIGHDAYFFDAKTILVKTHKFMLKGDLCKHPFAMNRDWKVI